MIVVCARTSNYFAGSMIGLHGNIGNEGRKVMKILFCMILISFCFVSPAISGETDEEKQLAETITILFQHKKTVMKQSMGLSKEESKVFWPLYKEYQKVLLPVVLGRAKLIRRFAKEHENFSEKKASVLIDEYLEIETKLLKIKKEHMGKFREKLPPKKVMRYFQMENKAEVGFRYSVAEELPLAE